MLDYLKLFKRFDPPSLYPVKILRLFILFLLFNNLSSAQNLRPFIDLTSSVFIPYFEIKSDLNVGVKTSKKIENYISVGAGFNKKITYNIKEMIVFKNLNLKGISPFILSQFKYGNIRQYNYLINTPGNPLLSNKNSFIIQAGIQVALKNNKIRIQIQSGLSYNFTKIVNPGEQLFSKEKTDVNLNSINSLSIINIF